MILCVDYGSRYVGLAITDPEERLALRYTVIDQKKSALFDELIRIVADEKVTKIIVGIPVSLSGKPSQQTLATVDFLKQLRQSIPRSVAIATIDETLTSKEAEYHGEVEGMNATDLHAEAARLMLEDYLKQ